MKRVHTLFLTFDRQVLVENNKWAGFMKRLFKNPSHG